MSWKAEDLKFSFRTDVSEGDVIAAIIETLAGVLQVMPELEFHGRALFLRGLHVQTDLKPNSVGIANLRVLARYVMNEVDCDEIVIEGAPRTTGVGYGRLPGRLQFARRDFLRSATSRELKPVSATLALARRGLSLLKAKRVIEEMMQKGLAVLELPTVENRAPLPRKTGAAGGHQGGALPAPPESFRL